MYIWGKLWGGCWFPIRAHIPDYAGSIPAPATKLNIMAGRPTSYKKEYCDILVEHFKEGGSIVEFCAEINICIQTFYNWCDTYPEFLESKKRGEIFSEAWWMRQGRVSLREKEFNYTGWYMNMKNRFKWADNQKIDHTTDGESINQINVKIKHAKDA